LTYALLGVIAVLLVAAIALLPDAPEPSVAGTTDTYERAPQPAGDDTDGASASEDDVPGTADRDADAPSVTESDADGSLTATEQYPDGEDAPDAPEATPDALWWYPGPARPGAGELVLVLDDAGNSLDGYDAFLSLPVPLTIAVLPQLRHSVQASAMAIGSGKEVILHQPMESTGSANPGPGVVLRGMERSEVETVLRENLATVPGAIGVNNHMGSAGTADAALMRSVMGELAARELFFLDSRTSAESVAAEASLEAGVPFAERKVFLDNEATRDAILSSFSGALERARDGEPIVMIGHVTVPVLAEVLGEVLPILQEGGYTFAPLSIYVHGRSIESREAG
jgi:polysaccharide deacetylase 2 family uncharacterized protein YibQ